MQRICSKQLELTASEPSQEFLNQKQISMAINKQTEETNLNFQPQEKFPECNYKEENRNDNDDNNEVEDIQLAWEHLEIARVYTEMKLNLLRDEGKTEEIPTTMKFLSVIHIKLGDLNCYQENFKEALIDYENCLSLRQFYDDRFYSRGIAEA